MGEIMAGGRLDGHQNSKGQKKGIIITVADLETMEQKFGELVSQMLQDLSSIKAKVKNFANLHEARLLNREETLIGMDNISHLLETYRKRHQQRSIDLEFMIRHGAPRKGNEEALTKLAIAMPLPRGMTTFLLDGTQMYRPVFWRIVIIWLHGYFDLVLGIIGMLPFMSWVKGFRRPTEQLPLLMENK